MIFNIKDGLYMVAISVLVILLGMKYVENLQLEADNENLKSVVIGMDAIHQRELQDNKSKVKRYESTLSVSKKTLEEKNRLLKEAKNAIKDTCEDSYRLLDVSGI